MMLIKCQPGSLQTSAQMQRLQGDRPFTIRCIYFKASSNGPYVAIAAYLHLKGKVHSPIIYDFIMQCTFNL